MLHRCREHNTADNKFQSLSRASAQQQNCDKKLRQQLIQQSAVKTVCSSASSSCQSLILQMESCLWVGTQQEEEDANAARHQKKTTRSLRPTTTLTLLCQAAPSLLVGLEEYNSLPQGDVAEGELGVEEKAFPLFWWKLLQRGGSGGLQVGLGPGMRAGGQRLRSRDLRPGPARNSNPAGPCSSPTKPSICPNGRVIGAAQNPAGEEPQKNPQ